MHATCQVNFYNINVCSRVWGLMCVHLVFLYISLLKCGMSVAENVRLCQYQKVKLMLSIFYCSLLITGWWLLCFPESPFQ